MELDKDFKEFIELLNELEVKYLAFVAVLAQRHQQVHTQNQFLNNFR